MVIYGPVKEVSLLGVGVGADELPASVGVSTITVPVSSVLTGAKVMVVGPAPEYPLKTVVYGPVNDA